MAKLNSQQKVRLLMTSRLYGQEVKEFVTTVLSLSTKKCDDGDRGSNIGQNCVSSFMDDLLANTNTICLHFYY